MSGRERRPVTIYEVAERAGVSIATVSRALRDSELVAAPTRRHVRKVAEELRFRPSRAGRALAEGQNAANGIVFPDLSGPTTPRSCSGTRRSSPSWAAAC